MPVLPGFDLCWDDGQQQYYAFRAETGETIYGAGENGDLSGLDRNFSSWRRPFEEQPNSVGKPCFSNDANTEAWGRQRPMSDAAAEKLYDKHYDFALGFFFYLSKQDGAALWTKPKGVPANMPCPDLDEQRNTVDQSDVEAALLGNTLLSETMVDPETGQGQEGEDTSNAGEWGHQQEQPFWSTMTSDVEWTTAYDETTQLEYYVNTSTGESQYDKPPELLMLENENGGAGVYGGGGGGADGEGYDWGAEHEEGEGVQEGGAGGAGGEEDDDDDVQTVQEAGFSGSEEGSSAAAAAAAAAAGASGVGVSRTAVIQISEDSQQGDDDDDDVEVGGKGGGASSLPPVTAIRGGGSPRSGQQHWSEGGGGTLRGARSGSNQNVPPPSGSAGNRDNDYWLEGGGGDVSRATTAEANRKSSRGSGSGSSRKRQQMKAATPGDVFVGPLDKRVTKGAMWRGHASDSSSGQRMVPKGVRPPLNNGILSHNSMVSLLNNLNALDANSSHSSSGSTVGSSSSSAGERRKRLMRRKSELGLFKGGEMEDLEELTEEERRLRLEEAKNLYKDTAESDPKHHGRQCPYPWPAVERYEDTTPKPLKTNLRGSLAGGFGGLAGLAAGAGTAVTVVDGQGQVITIPPPRTPGEWQQSSPSPSRPNSNGGGGGGSPSHEDGGNGGGGDGSNHNFRTVLPYITTRALKPSVLPNMSYLDAASMHQGPYIRRTGVGKHMTRAVNRLPQQATTQDRVAMAAQRGDHLFLAARDVNYEEWMLGEKVTAMDGNLAVDSTLEPMVLLRAAYEDGAEAVVETMGRFPDNPEVQVFGLIQLVKYEYSETSEGHANPGGLVALKATLRVMQAYPEDEAVQGHALAVLASLSDNYAMRWVIFKEDWMGPTVVALNGNQSSTQEVFLDHGPDRPQEKLLITQPSRHAIDTCAWACKFFGQMACDNARRVVVADDALPLILKAMQFCPEEGVVQMNGCRALYNCVYRCEAAHIMAAEEDALSVVSKVMEDFQADPQLMLLAQRTSRSLQPDGWHGNADDPHSIVVTKEGGEDFASLSGGDDGDGGGGFE